VELGIGADGGSESSNIGVAKLFRDNEHVGFVAGDFVFTDLEDLRGG
jgi:hypothetical protein